MTVQLVPEPFVEIPVELADELGIAAATRYEYQRALSIRG